MTERYERQEKLAEVGRCGQERIGSASLMLPAELDRATRALAERYGWGAGLARTQSSPGAKPPATSVLTHFRHQTSREVAAGASLALQSILLALETGSDPA